MRSEARSLSDLLTDGGLGLLAAGLTVYLAFNSGGYFPGATSVAALVLAFALLVRIVAAGNPFEGLSYPLAVAAGALMLYAVWTLVSASWSDSSARALLEFNRVLLYLLALLFFGSYARTDHRVRHVVWGVAAATVAVSTAGFLTRTLPNVFHLAPAVQDQRLNYPIGYWNALGLLAAVGIVLCLHLTSSERESPVVRILGAAALPVLGPTLLFTFSRGPLAAVVFGVVAYLLLARPRGAVAGLIATVPATTLAAITAYDADLLASKHPRTPEAAAQGNHVARIVAICVMSAVVLRAGLLWLDARLVRLRLDPHTRRWLAAGAVVLALAAVVVILTGTSATDRVEAQYHRLTRSNVMQTGDYRDRLTDPGINRLDHWNIALDAFRGAPLRGQGAGTYALLWNRHRPTDSDSVEGHSLYLEQLGELGFVGAVLLAIVLLTVLAVVALRARGPRRALFAAVFAAMFTWVLHAGIDWDWEITAVTLWLFMLGGSALAAAKGTTGRLPAPGPASRAVLGVSCVALAATPALVNVSQGRLADSVKAFKRGDCATATRKANASLSVLGNRPEPYEILGYCYARSGQGRTSIEAATRAVERDPRNWQYHYASALVRAAAGHDPRPAVRESLRLNPKERRAKDAVARFHGRDPASWRRAARAIDVSLP
jgi:hypothetical protein